MGLKKTELELSPEVNGVVTLHGKPITGAKVHRYLSYGDKEFNDNVRTDVDGRFTLPVKTAKIRVSPMLDTWVSQVLVVEHADKKIEIWTAGATSVLDSDSIKLLLSGIYCELSAPEMKIGLSRKNPQSPLLWMVSTCNFKHDDIIIEKGLNK
ncbi:carboxypeptidase-like regulatory domain-containing protein [Shewanella baltica]|uniref:carboxypeptidase-like regulatory domain-containing protein n=1 Tax=Shewanella baltica TaxID=62322 RepID=UPI00217D920B|nr:carboxypeptidase-like regulatory domain-containing protein [Shewanella baltica]MCS6177986.1 carboxypeptidase regulatory-like domain-containing protein [Shewanella baltica]MCS6254132.1 carboxypeptidase regulatory-like domain-containing protein [Shewanella baltica]